MYKNILMRIFLIVASEEKLLSSFVKPLKNHMKRQERFADSLHPFQRTQMQVRAVG